MHFIATSLALHTNFTAASHALQAYVQGLLMLYLFCFINIKFYGFTLWFAVFYLMRPPKIKTPLQYDYIVAM